jgi:FkbM family methyltransferase
MGFARAPAFGTFVPSSLDRFIIRLTSPLPDNWFGLRLAILLRRAVTMRLKYPDGALDVERWGMKVRLHPRDNGCEKNLLFTPKMYEPVELHELKSDLHRARRAGRPFVFLDIGANVGLFSLFVAAHGGPNTRILAFEPDPVNLRRLRFNIEANPKAAIEVHPIALGDEEGYLELVAHPRDRGATMTRKIASPEVSAGARVTCRTLLDALSKARVDAVDAIKIDVEQFEDNVLVPFFKYAPPRLLPELVIIEDSRSSWKFDLVGMMRAKGYSLVERTTHLNLILRRQPGAGVKLVPDDYSGEVAKPLENAGSSVAGKKSEWASELRR